MGGAHYLQSFVTIAYSWDRRRLASTGYSGSIIVWDLTNGHELSTIRAEGAQSIAFSPDGRRLVSGNSGNAVKLWDLASGQELRTLTGHTKEVRSVAFSPDGGRLASASDDMTVRVWDARPLTPELRVEREACGLLEHLFADKIPGKAELLEKLRSNRTINERVRQKALVLADAYWKNSVHQQASRLVDQLYVELLFKHDVVERLREHDGIMREVQQEALALAESWPQDSGALYRGIRTKLIHPGGDVSRYRLALRQAEEACRLEPVNSGFQLMRAIAQYRLGEYQQALDTLV
jgi:hypothetical protein